MCVCAKFEPNYGLPPRTVNVASKQNADVQNAHVFAFVKLLKQFLIQCRLLVDPIKYLTYWILINIEV